MAEISKKVWRVRFFTPATRRWTRRGAVIGFLVGILLPPMVIAVSLLRAVSRPNGALSVQDTIGWIALMFILSPLMMPIVFGTFAFLLASLVRPVWVALFCSIEHFEEEFGSCKR